MFLIWKGPSLVPGIVLLPVEQQLGHPNVHPRFILLQRQPLNRCRVHLPSGGSVAATGAARQGQGLESLWLSCCKWPSFQNRAHRYGPGWNYCSPVLMVLHIPKDFWLFKCLFVLWSQFLTLNSWWYSCQIVVPLRLPLQGVLLEVPDRGRSWLEAWRSDGEEFKYDSFPSCCPPHCEGLGHSEEECMPTGLEEWIKDFMEFYNLTVKCPASHPICANIYLGFLLLENHLLFHFTYLLI